jgi:hypothetical protein
MNSSQEQQIKEKWLRQVRKIEIILAYLSCDLVDKVVKVTGTPCISGFFY